MHEPIYDAGGAIAHADAAAKEGEVAADRPLRELAGSSYGGD